MPARPATPTRRALMEVPLEDYTESQNVLVYGLPDAGKTSFSASAPNASHWNFEPGIVSAVKRGGKGGLVILRTFLDLKEAVRMAQRGEFDHRTWLILDTISTGQHKALNEALAKSVAENPRRDADVPAVQEYLKAQNGIKHAVEAMVDLPINCLFLAHAMNVQDANGGTLWLPSVQGGQDKGFPVSNYIMALMNVVGFMHKTVNSKGEQVRRILWNTFYDVDTDTRYVAKDQYEVLGSYSDNTTMAEVAAKLSGAKPPKKDKARAKRA